MEDYKDLENLLAGIQPEEDGQMSEEVMSQEVPVAEERAPAAVEAPEFDVPEAELMNSLAATGTEDAGFDEMAEYKALMDQYKEKMNEKPEESSDDKVMNWMTGIGQAADVMNKIQGTNPNGSPVKYWGDQQKKAAEDKKAKELEKLTKLMSMNKTYSGMKKAKKGDSNSKVFQTRSGLVKYNKETGEVTPVYQDPYMAGTLDLKQQGQDLREEKAGRLSDVEVEAITAFDDGVRILDDIDAILKEDKGEVNDLLGPYASRIENASDWIPGTEMDEKFVRTQQLVGIQLADYVKSISGSAVSEQEAARLLKNIPNMTDKPKAFKTKLNQFRKDLAEAKELKLRNIGKQKKSAKKYMDELKKKDLTGQSEYVTMVAPSGQERSVKRSQVEKYLKKGAKIKE